jgi:CO/xanthine dehydrogenase Mo-binding subunit
LKEKAAPHIALDAACAMSDYSRKWFSYELLREKRRESKEYSTKTGRDSFRGIGIACAYQGNGLLYPLGGKGGCEVEATLNKDGSLEIKTSMDAADELLELWRAVGTELLGVDPRAVRIISGSTALTPNSGPDCLSTKLCYITRLVERCCTAIRKLRFRDPLPITVRRSYAPSKALNWEGKSFDGASFSRLSWAAAVLEVEIDMVQFRPKIRGLWLAVDGGRIFSERRARHTLKTSAIQALSWASMEELDYVDGRISEKQFHDYAMPGTSDKLPVTIQFVGNDAANSKAAPKGIGELPFNCVPAAFVQAVSQAVDYPFEHIPLKTRDIWNGLNKRPEKEETAK